MEDFGIIFYGSNKKLIYQIGAWNALKKINYSKKIKYITGNSLSFFNAIMFAQTTLNNAQIFWSKFNFEDKNYLQEFLKTNFRLNYILSYENKLFLMKEKSLFSKAVKYISTNEIELDDILNYNFFAKEQDLPMQPFIDNNVKNIIVINSSKKEFDYSKYPNHNIVEISPKIDCENLSDEEVMELGYNDTKEILAEAFPGDLSIRYNKNFFIIADERRKKANFPVLRFGEMNPQLQFIKNLLFEVHQNYYLGFFNSVCIISGCLLEQGLQYIIEEEFIKKGVLTLNNCIVENKEDITKLSLGRLIGMIKKTKLLDYEKWERANELHQIRNFSIHSVLPKFVLNEKKKTYNSILDINGYHMTISIAQQEVDTKILSNESSEIWSYYIISRTKNILIPIFKNRIK